MKIIPVVLKLLFPYDCGLANFGYYLTVLWFGIGLLISGSLFYANNRSIEVRGAHYVEALPSKIDVTGVLAVWEDSEGVSPLPFIFLGPLSVFIFREGCGGAVFHLSEKAAQEIEENGLSFFNDAVQGRGYPASDVMLYQHYKYSPWQMVSSPQDMTGATCPYDIEMDKKIAHEVYNAQKNGTAYYTKKDEGDLLVLPDARLVVYTFSG